jgi:branched-chain amino acid transport system permease protein
MIRKMNKTMLYGLLMIVIFVLLPIIIRGIMGRAGNYLILVSFYILMYAAMGSAWNIIGGFGRQISWAHAGFFAIGAYSTIIPLLKWEISPWIGMLIGIVLSTITAFIIGYPSFRLRGVYFSLCTLAFGQIINRLLLHFTSFTGGASGLVMKNIKEDNVAMMLFTNTDIYYYCMLSITVVIFLICAAVEKSRLGYYLKAIREDETAAETIGIRPNRVKLSAFILSAALMSVIGVFYAMRIRYIDPESVSSHDLAIRIGMTVIIGGIGTLWGPIIGAVITVPLLEVTSAYFGSMLNGGLSFFLYGLILVATVIFLPEGVISLKDKRRKVIGRKG